MNRTLSMLLVGCALLLSVREMRGQASTEPDPVTLKREYRDGETIAYLDHVGGSATVSATFRRAH
jgi:hypothetical protein